MVKWRRIFTALTVFMCMSLIASLTLAKAPDEQYSDEITQAEALGKIIYEKDIAAWVATDKMLEDLGDDVSGLPLRGWVTDKDGGRYRVNFIGEDKGETRIYYQAWTKGKKVKKTKNYKQGIALNGKQAAMWAARKLVSAQKFKQCSKRYNTVVIPYADGGTDGGDDAGVGMWYVYLFASTTDASEVVMGGHHRYAVSSDGQHVLSQISFTNSCLVLNKGHVPDGSTLASLMVSHIKTPYPQESHVFANYSHGIDFYVTIVKPALLWKIHNGKIKLVKGE